MIIVTVDSSLSDTGVAVLRIDDQDEHTWAVHTLSTTARKGGDTPRDYMNRIRTIAAGLYEIIDALPEPPRTAIEGPAFSSATGRVHERGGLWWELFGVLFDLGDGDPTVVGPTMRAKYATGSGTANKDTVQIAAVRRYDTAPIRNNNEADAVIIAAMVARLEGHPVDGKLTAKCLEAMKTLVPF